MGGSEVAMDADGGAMGRLARFLDCGDDDESIAKAIALIC